MDPKHKRHHLNVLGPFYVVDGCCTACGVPQLFASELVGESDDSHCYIKRQPRAAVEVDAIMRVMVSQELSCIRYGGTEEAVLRRLAENGEGELCDIAPPADAVSLRLDHVVFSARAATGPWTPREILERLVAFAARWRTTAIFDDGTVATVSVSWFEDKYHRVEALASHHRGEWLVRHYGPPRLSDTLHDWLTQEPAFEDIRWHSKPQWKLGRPSRKQPW